MIRQLTIAEACEIYQGLLHKVVPWDRKTRESFTFKQWEYAICSTDLPRRPRIFGLTIGSQTFPFLERLDYETKTVGLTHPMEIDSYELTCYYTKHLEATGLLSPAMSEGKILYYPIVEKSHATFSEYLSSLSGSRRTHFFGTKAKQITWRIEEDLNSEDRLRILEIVIQHAFDFGERYGMDEVAYNFWSMYLDYDFPIMVARDATKHDLIVCAMVLIPGNTAWSADVICRDISPEYKTHSLILCAQLALARDLLWEKGMKQVDLGLNFGEGGDYKDSIGITKVPLYNLPTFSLDAGVAEINVIFKQKAMSNEVSKAV